MRFIQKLSVLTKTIREIEEGFRFKLFSIQARDE
jgi:hypothetical protein